MKDIECYIIKSADDQPILRPEIPSQCQFTELHFIPQLAISWHRSQTFHTLLGHSDFTYDIVSFWNSLPSLSTKQTSSHA